MNYSVRKTGRIDPAKAEEYIYGRKTYYRSPSVFIGGQLQFNKSTEYGRMGEVTRETRTLNTQRTFGARTRSAVMQFQSDYLGRINRITYPDGEVVSYDYDPGGQLTSVRGTRSDGVRESVSTFIERIGYDRYGQRTFIIYGNGVRTNYSYNPHRRWLDALSSTNPRGHSLQNLSCSFDKVGNITKRRDEGQYACSRDLKTCCNS